MTSHPFHRGLARFLDSLLGQPYYFSGEAFSRVSNVSCLPLLADAEFLHADDGISLDGVLKYEHGRPWKHFELLLTWLGSTMDFTTVKLHLDGKPAGEGFAYFFPEGMHVDVTGPEYALQAQLHALPDRPHNLHWRLHGVLKTSVTLYGFNLTGGISRPPLSNVVSLRPGHSSDEQ